MDESETIVYYHPSCSKCVFAMEFLKNQGIPFQTVNYLENPFTKKELKNLLHIIGVSVKDVIRKNEPIFINKFQSALFTDEDWFSVLEEYPELLQRPLLVKGTLGNIARDESSLREFKKNSLLPVELISSENFKTIEWAGGTTSQFYIYPKSASYAERNFDFRISKALIKVKGSDFTYLQDYCRALIMLDNEIELTVDNRYVKVNPENPFYFSGNVKIQSQGKGTDINVICKNNFIPEIKLIKNNGLDTYVVSRKDKEFVFIYIVKGAILIDNLQCLEGMFLRIHRNETKIQMNRLQEIRMILIRISETC